MQETMVDKSHLGGQVLEKHPSEEHHLKIASANNTLGSQDQEGCTRELPRPHQFSQGEKYPGP
jgi:hypothetical protein